MNQAMTRLSTGVRINSAKNDAADLAITSKMTSQINGLKQTVRNANDAISMVQIVERATQEITNMLQRMRELALQSISDSNTDSDRNALDDEFQELAAEIGRISDNTQWNGTNLLDGHSFIGGANFQVGSNADQIIKMSFGDFSHNSLSSVFGTALSGLNIKGLGDNPSWTMKGAPFQGYNSGDMTKYGQPTADGKHMLIFGRDRPADSGRGPVQVYEWNGAIWEQKGADFFPQESGNDTAIMSSSISDDGETIVVSEGLMDAPKGANSGRARVFDWIGTDWVQRGVAIDGEHSNDVMTQYGISADGNTILTNSRLNDDGGNYVGQARVFDWDGSAWVQRGFCLLYTSPSPRDS